MRLTRGLLYTIALLTGLTCPAQGWGAVAFGAIGAGAGQVNSINVAYPTGIASGNLLFLCIANKYPPNGPATPTGFTAPANNQGTGDPGDGPGIGVGATYATVYYRVADGSESGTVTVSVTSGNALYGVMARYTNATGAWAVGAANGGDSTAGTAWSATMGTDPGVQGGDMVLACNANNNNTSLGSAYALSQTGVTYGTATERLDNSTSFGDDVGIKFADHAVTSGTSSAAPVHTWTASASAAGGTALLRIRESGTSTNHAAYRRRSGTP